VETSVNIDRLRSYANIISNSTINGIVRAGDYKYLKAKIKKYDNKYIQEESRTYQEYFSYLFNTLKLNYRYEYIYKNVIINKILLEKYSLDTTSVLNEFHVNKSIADLVLINGTSKVFEIKTELDTPIRLANQVADYKRVFKEIFIVTHHTLKDKYLEILSGDIGLIVLTENYSLNTIREPQVNNNFDNLTILKCLRKNEYSNILLTYFGHLPQVTDFKFYSACKELFAEIPSQVLHELMMRELKKRSVKEKGILESKIVPEELKHICLCLDFNKNEYKVLNAFLQKKLKL
jgi:hypothetical protein